MMLIKQRKRGFSLIEFVIVMTIVSIISAVAARIVYQGYKSYKTSETIIEANWQARYSIERMKKFMRSISSPASIISSSPSQITFSDTNGNVLSYSLNSSNQIVRSNTAGTGEDELLASNISSLAFTFQDEEGNVISTATANNIRYINIDLTSTLNNANIQVQAKVNIRNSP